MPQLFQCTICGHIGPMDYEPWCLLFPSAIEIGSCEECDAMEGYLEEFPKPLPPLLMMHDFTPTTAPNT